MLRLGYNTNGFNCHSLESALEIISDLGYRGVAITLDNYILNPAASDLQRQLDRTQALLKKHSLACVIETGARFLLDPWRKHSPTLISADPAARQIRLDFLKRALDIAAHLAAEALSFWSGTKPDDVRNAQAWHWLAAGCRVLAEHAGRQGVPLAFEPEPGMFVSTLAHYRQLKQAVGSEWFGLTLDIGHAHLTEAISIGECIRKYRQDIRNIHLEDMQKPFHRHLFFGEGDIDFAGVFKTLTDINCRALINVELSRHSHIAVATARESLNFLRKFLGDQPTP